MTGLILPKDYKSELSVIETEQAIKELRQYFEKRLADVLHLSRISAPLFVRPETGLNDNLNEVETPVSFDAFNKEISLEIVHSLAKWKRYALNKYGFEVHTGIYTNMNAIRKDETPDNIHSIYVDQWDWEQVIKSSDRSIDTLKEIVEAIYGVMLDAEAHMCSKYSVLKKTLPPKITFVTTQEIEDAYPHLPSDEREYNYAKEHGAIFVIGIGGALNSGKPHDRRAADYDDWSLNGDIIVYYPLLDIAVELSSMGIRVDKDTLLKQLEIAGGMNKLELPFHRDVISGKLPQTIGGGIGQSRLCMLLLQKAHIGEVQVSAWPSAMEEACEKDNIHFL